jgi:hypothetical protein
MLTTYRHAQHINGQFNDALFDLQMRVSLLRARGPPQAHVFQYSAGRANHVLSACTVVSWLVFFVLHT